ncbi:DUF922 domain-containing protein [Aeromonas simiae]|nr:DUF922 domain-containing protein [Aeromonas simiae]
MKKTGYWLGAWLLLGALPAQGAMVQSESSVQVNFYPITAATARQWLPALGIRAPLVGDVRVLGKASYRLDWQLDLEPSAQGCRLRQVTTRLKGEVALPRWYELETASAHERRDWYALLGALADYEGAQRRLVQDGAWQIGYAIAALPTAVSCPALQEAAWQQGQQELKRVQKALNVQAEQSGHGRRFGAIWPQ